MNNIRNFSIIAHVDHGKSTLADRFIQLCGGLSEREMASQVLDSMELERERGITIKAQSVSLNYEAPDGERYTLNFIDTPGHVDFSYEVSRSLAACEGALLVVDAAQGVEAQSVANCHTAVDQGLAVIPVMNKIDLPSADIEKVRDEIENIIGIDASDSALVSAKNGKGVPQLLAHLVKSIPPPQGAADGPTRALIVDSWFDNYLGVVSLVRIFEGSLKEGEKVTVMSSGVNTSIEEVGIFTPKKQKRKTLNTGEVGYIVAGIKNIDGAPVGATITNTNSPASNPLPGFKQSKPNVFAGLYPVDSKDYEPFREALSKLKLNDSAFVFEPETSDALGFGFRCGFLGMLHMEIVQERLEREYKIALITTAPTVIYEIELTNGQALLIDNPSKLPPPNQLKEIREPIITVDILVPQDHLGNVINLCVEKRGVQKSLNFLGGQASICYLLPMAEVVTDFFDRLKSVTRGYASMDYQFHSYETARVVKVDFLISGQQIDALSVIVHSDLAQKRGREIAAKMKSIIPRQMFDIAVQASLGSKIIARETIKALRKNVTAKCYGGDATRKRKLLEKQKAGKKRMKQLGSVDIPQEAFMAVLATNRVDR